MSKNDDAEYYWTVDGLAPYTKYKFRVVILLTGSRISEDPELLLDNIDTNRIIVTQPSFVVRTNPSEIQTSSKPIIISVQQVRLE